MASFGSKSKERLESCHSDIQAILNEAIKEYDFSVIEGTRSAATQYKYFKEGFSKLDGVHKQSKHQSNPSMAVDIAPYVNGKIEWNDHREWNKLARTLFKHSQKLLNEGKITHRLRWGGFWTSFVDKPHWELKVN
jgi:peptidoglycan L-alanyl-D-glutamate endopeptidase CwlK